MVAVNDPECPGIAVLTVELKPTQLGCAEQSGKPGEVAISTAGEAVWLVVGDQTFRAAGPGGDLARTDG